MAKKTYERDVEAYLVKEVAKRGGVAEKFSSPNRTNVPDRLVQWPDSSSRNVLANDYYPAYVEFVECKAPGKRPTLAQQRDHDRRRAMGFVVYVVSSYEDVDLYLEHKL